MYVCMMMYVHMYLLVRAAHRQAGNGRATQMSSTDEMNMDDLDTNDLDVCMFDDVCVCMCLTCTCWAHTQTSWTQMSCTDKLDIAKLYFC